jgi:two-component system, sensor histidine kinase and response regulator
VAKDNLTNQKVIVMRLEKLGCTVNVACNGYEAVLAAGAMEYDLVLMDCQMPLMDGLRARAEIRKKSGRRVPIIAPTANAMNGERERCLEADMDDYISKPVRAEDLFNKLKYWIGRDDGECVAANDSGMKPTDGVRAALDQFISGDREDVDLLFTSFLKTTAE